MAARGFASSARVGAGSMNTSAHKTPLSPAKTGALHALVEGLSREQVAWVSGYLAGLGAVAEDQAIPAAAPAPEVMVLHGSQTGNAERVARDLHARLAGRGLAARIDSLGAYPGARLGRERVVLIVVSTYGEGEPPDAAQAFHAFVMGERAPRLADLRYAVVLVDACKYWLPQSRRHACIADTVGIRQLVVAVNKMDLIGYCEAAFAHIRDEFLDFASRLHFARVTFIPMSALKGDMVVERGGNLPWYEGPTLLEALEQADIPGAVGGAHGAPFRFPVQWVSRPGAPGRAARRGYMGRVASGGVAVGDEVMVLPSGRRTHVEEIDTHDGVLARTQAPQSVTLYLEDDVDVARGDMIVAAPSPPAVTKAFAATVCWLSSEPMSLRRRRYLIKHGTKTVSALFSRPHYRLNIATLERDTGVATLAMNDIGRVTVHVQDPLPWDTYIANRATGSFIVIDALTHDTVGAGLIEGSADAPEALAS
ncbi:MAG: flavodoxin domain-containing protein [Gammaproteobacteria bacterium]|nr:flavodoxin domain-containing protein [Gammaproteobacteria bacterium]